LRNARGVPALTSSQQGEDRPSTGAQERILARLQPFIADALNTLETFDVPLLKSGDAELVVADGNGRIVYLSVEARRLLALAAHAEIGSGGMAQESRALPPAVVRICENLTRVLNNKNTTEAPEYHHRSVWGDFTFRAYRLDPTDASSSLVGVTVAHRQPLPIGLAWQISQLPLTARQAEVCFLMTVGLSYAEIAERLGISPHTAIAHSRLIYEKLDVSNRTELATKLLAS
jgi:DNA-binding CsgD family transcriptional regulator